MKKRLLMILAVAVLLVGCGNTDKPDTEANKPQTETDSTTETQGANTEEESTATESEKPHEHAYTEAITTDASCEADGVKTFTCECGDTYTEQIEATGHSYGDYVYNNDATYEADGTETATCVCGLTDTRTVSGSKLEYTYTDLDKTMYAKQSVNVRDLPSTDGKKLGGLSANQEVKVTGQCNETSWYRIEYNGGIAYVSNSYLVYNKPEEPKPEEPSKPETLPFELYTVYDTGDTIYFWDEPGDYSEEGTAKRAAVHSKCWELAVARWGADNCAGFFQYDSYKANGKFYSVTCWKKTN